MLFRRYRTLCLLIIVLSFIPLIAGSGYYLQGLPPFKGLPQGATAQYPSSSPDRSLIDLNGAWEGFAKLNPSVLLGTAGSKLFVPGSFAIPVVVKKFFLANELSSRNFTLHILSIGSSGRIFINGISTAEFIGSFKQGNVPQTINIPAPRLKFGEENTLVIALDKTDSRGPWLNFPGLTGDIYLEAVGPIRLEAPALSTSLKAGSAELSYDIPVKRKAQGEITATVRLQDAGGIILSSEIKKLAGENLRGKFTITDPKLWSPANPNLYRLEVTATGERGERDSQITYVGLRTVKIQRGSLLINGQRLEPKILLRVNDTAESGGAANPGALEQDIRWAKEKGYNIIYLPDHFPPPHLLDLADKYGLFIMYQTPVNGAPDKLVLAKSLQEVSVIHTKFAYHSSLLAEGLGAGLDTEDTEVAEYVKQGLEYGTVFYTRLKSPSTLVFPGGGELELKGPYLADYLGKRYLRPSKDFLVSHTANSGLLNRNRLPKASTPPSAAENKLPPYAPLVSAALVLLVMFFSWGKENLRFSNLGDKKPRRIIRQRAQVQFYWYILRTIILSLLLVQVILTLRDSPLFGYLVGRIPLLALQTFIWFLTLNPLVLAGLIIGLGLIFSLFSASLQARTLPGKPGAMALLLWQEKRKRWIVAVAAAWAATYFGSPQWVVWIILGLGICISFLTTGKDIRWAGGKTRRVIFLPLLLVTISGVLVYNLETVKFIYHWLKL